MKYYRIKPSKSLSGHVRYFWVGEVEASGEDEFTYFAIAASSAKLVFHYQGRFDEVGKLHRSYSSGMQGQSKIYTQ